MRSDGTAYYATADGHAYAVNPNGTQQWSYLFGFQDDCSPIVTKDGSVIYGSDSGSLFALDPTGALLWQSSVTAGPGEVDSALAESCSGVIYAGGQNGWTTLDAMTGNTVWQVPATGFAGALMGSPNVAQDGSMYGIDSGGQGVAIDPNGNVLWKKVLGAGGASTDFARAWALQLFAVLNDGYLHAYDIATGDQQWQQNVNNSAELFRHGAPVVDGNMRLYFNSNDGYLYCFDTSGKQLLQASPPAASRRPTTTPTAPWPSARTGPSTCPATTTTSTPSSEPTTPIPRRPNAREIAELQPSSTPRRTTVSILRGRRRKGILPLRGASAELNALDNSLEPTGGDCERLAEAPGDQHGSEAPEHAEAPSSVPPHLITDYKPQPPGRALKEAQAVAQEKSFRSRLLQLIHRRRQALLETIPPASTGSRSGSRTGWRAGSRASPRTSRASTPKNSTTRSTVTRTRSPARSGAPRTTRSTDTTPGMTLDDKGLIVFAWLRVGFDKIPSNKALHDFPARSLPSAARSRSPWRSTSSGASSSRVHARHDRRGGEQRGRGEGPGVELGKGTEEECAKHLVRVYASLAPKSHDPAYDEKMIKIGFGETEGRVELHLQGQARSQGGAHHSHLSRASRGRSRRPSPRAREVRVLSE